MVIILGALLCSPLLFALAYRARPDVRLPLESKVLVYYTAALGGITLLSRILYSPISAMDWNAKRLQASFVLLSGEKIYPSIGNGVFMMGVNGPIPPFLYLPTTLASSPVAAIWIGSLVSATLFLVPTWLLLRENRNRFTAIAAFAGMVATVLTLPSLDKSAFRVHADASAIFFSAMALWQLHRWGHGGKRSSLIAASALAPLAFFCKISFAPASMLVLAYLLLRRASWRDVGIAVGTMAGVTVAATLVGCLLSHPGGFYNMFDALGQSYKVSDATAASTKTPFMIVRRMGVVLMDTIKDQFALFGLGTGILLLFTPQRRGEAPSLPWLLWIASAFFFPAAVLGRSRYGAEANVLTPCHYFLVLGIWRALFEPAPELAHVLRRVRFAFLVALALPLTLGLYGLLWPMQELTRSREGATADVLRRGVDVYFPDYPLSHYIVQKRLYHAGSTVAETNMSLDPIPKEQFFRYAPERPQAIGVDSPGARKIVDRYYPTYVPGKLAGFASEGWDVFVPGS